MAECGRMEGGGRSGRMGHTIAAGVKGLLMLYVHWFLYSPLMNGLLKFM